MAMPSGQSSQRQSRSEAASSLSASSSTASSISSAGPDHLEAGHWTFQPPNLVFDLAAGQVCFLDTVVVREREDEEYRGGAIICI